MSWLGLVNPYAGSAQSNVAELVSTATSLGLEVSFVETSSSVELNAAVEYAYDGGVRKYIAVGGDGTAHLVVNALMEIQDHERCSLGIVSVGSGSDFTRTFGHERGIEPGLARIAEDNFYPIDIARVAGSFGSRYFLNALNVGVAAASVSTAESLPRWMGPIRYRVSFWIALWPFRSGPIQVRVGRHMFAGDAINVVVANGQFFGGGLNIAPMSMLNDGRVDVQIFSGRKRQAFSIMPRLLVGSHLTHRAVQRYSGSDIQIDVPDAWPVEADGEMLGTGSVSVSVVADALDFAV